MNLFGSLLNAVMTGFENNPGVAGALGKEILQRFQQNQGGGLAGLVEQLGKQGLGDAVNSWVGSGPNQNVAPSQLGQALGKDMLEQLAAKFGITPDEVKTHLAEILPKIVDRLTPDGKLPAGLPGSPA